MKTVKRSAEALKLLACATMLIDHIGAVLFPKNLLLRIIGRIAFPIFCFLLVEGVYHTKNPTRYALRLSVALVLSELPFDLCFCGHFSWERQSVMFTLLLGFLMLHLTKDLSLPKKLLLTIPFALIAEALHTDYGALGIAMIALFAFTRGFDDSLLLQWCGLALLCLSVFFSNFLQLFCVAAMVPISMYSGQKRTGSKTVQWFFYLFYPVHLTVLWLLSQCEI